MALTIASALFIGLSKIRLI
nr:cytochrome b6/f complex subunit VI [Elsholtzia minima]UYF21389.1 cytochrome b6/f complex subunit VI [Elsholtzia minima]